MSRGIYCYLDTENNNEIVYIGKDSHIDENRRDKQHNYPSKYNEQPINRIIQNNPSRFEYMVLGVCNKLTENTTSLNMIEQYYIDKYSPRFNFTKGGDGCLGRTLSKETKQKIGNANKGNMPWCAGKTLSKETRIKQSTAINKTGVYRVMKAKDNHAKQGFTWIYAYYNKGNLRRICSVDPSMLKEKVLTEGLEWIVLDEDKAMENGLL